MRIILLLWLCLYSDQSDFISLCPTVCWLCCWDDRTSGNRKGTSRHFVLSAVSYPNMYFSENGSGLGIRLLSPIMTVSYRCLWLFLCSSEMELQSSGEYTGFQWSCFCSWHWHVQSNSSVVWSFVIPDLFLLSFLKLLTIFMFFFSHTHPHHPHPHTLTPSLTPRSPCRG